MKALVFDTSALLALLFDEPGAETVEALMHRAAEKEQPMLMSAINWAETCHRIEAKRGKDALARAKEFASNTPIAIVPADRELAEAAAACRAAGLLALADSFAAALTRQCKAELVTADREFSSIKKTIDIIWLK